MPEYYHYTNINAETGKMMCAANTVDRPGGIIASRGVVRHPDAGLEYE